jgi:hypothetical protein
MVEPEATVAVVKNGGVTQSPNERPRDPSPMVWPEATGTETIFNT